MTPHHLEALQHQQAEWGVANESLSEFNASTSSYRLTTEKFADALDLRPQSIRKRYAQTGSYFGIVPSKLPNGRLRWPPDAIAKLHGKEGM